MVFHFNEAVVKTQKHIFFTALEGFQPKMRHKNDKMFNNLHRHYWQTPRESNQTMKIYTKQYEGVRDRKLNKILKTLILDMKLRVIKMTWLSRYQIARVLAQKHFKFMSRIKSFWKTHNFRRVIQNRWNRNILCSINSVQKLGEANEITFSLRWAYSGRRNADESERVILIDAIISN